MFASCSLSTGIEAVPWKQAEECLLLEAVQKDPQGMIDNPSSALLRAESEVNPFLRIAADLHDLPGRG